MENKKETPINKDYQIQSLIGQVANQAVDISEKDALIRMQYDQINELHGEIKQLRDDQITEMNKGAGKVMKGGEKNGVGKSGNKKQEKQ